jgi:tetratricopeptide (TPR) repeat protein
MYHARTDLAQIEVPDTVNRVIMSRMDRLDESSRNVLRVASVIGKDFKQWLLSAIYPYRQTEEELSERLADLSQREILEGPQRDWLYLFRHVLTREVAYESLLYADRRQLHRRVGESIETQEDDRLAEYWEVLAFHFSLAEQWDKALDYHLAAGRKAQSVYANEAAVHHFREALKAAERTPGSEAQQLTTHECLGDVLANLGDYDEALAHNYQALGLVMVASASTEEMARHLAELCCKTASIHEKKSDYAIAFNWLRGGLLAVEGVETVEGARIYLLGAGIYRRQGKNIEAITWCENSLATALHRLSGTTRESQQVAAQVYYNLGGIHTRQGDLMRAAQYCQQSIRVFQEIDDIVGESQAHINLANVYFEQGNWPEATEHYLRALEIERKIGDVYSQAMVTLNLGGVYLNQGDLDQALSYYKQSLVKWQSLGSTYATALLRNNMAAVALRRQDPAQALALLQESLDLFQQINSVDFLPEIYRHLAEAHLLRKDIEQAHQHAHQSLALAQEHKLRLEEGITRRVLGQVYVARHEPVQAELELEQSQRILEELNSRYEVGQTLYQLARLYREQGRHTQASDTLAKAIAIFQELGARLDLAEAQAFNPA